VLTSPRLAPAPQRVFKAEDGSATCAPDEDMPVPVGRWLALPKRDRDRVVLPIGSPEGAARRPSAITGIFARWPVLRVDQASPNNPVAGVGTVLVRELPGSVGRAVLVVEPQESAEYDDDGRGDQKHTEAARYNGARATSKLTGD
jgi:hypothetical protein